MGSDRSRTEFALDWQNGWLAINNVRTNISKCKVENVYQSMLAMADEKKAMKFAAEMIIDKLKALFD